MNQEEKIIKGHKKVKVLVAPLDWGLGHATRCIPVIHELLKADYEVLIGANGPIKTLLQTEFPQLTFIPLLGYNITYGASKQQTFFKLLVQIPKILGAIKKEKKWLETIIKQHAIDVVIADNRYGLYNASVFCVFITHQLYIKTFLGKLSEQILQHINYCFINRFHQCWVPDTATPNNLGGVLSHPKKKPVVPVTYIGPLSRFDKSSVQQTHKHLLILLSGPEPQRTILENILIQQLQHYQKPVLFVRGLPAAPTTLSPFNNVIFKNHLPARGLEVAILDAAYIISRCGYSTVMDLLQLQKKSIFIPTPGQTEQTYLAQHLLKKQLALCIKQHHFNLQQALQTATTFPYQIFNNSTTDLLTVAIMQLKHKIAT